jgi:hypothetical protein
MDDSTTHLRKETKWYAEIKRYLELPEAPRILSVSAICRLIDIYNPNIDVSKIPAALHELLQGDFLKLVTKELSINLSTNPVVEYAELAYWIRPHSVVSLSSIVQSELIETTNSRVTIQCVVPSLGKRIRDSELVETNGINFEFYTLPQNFFPPLLEDYGDCYDITKPYPCFTKEKAFLDLLYLASLKKYAGLHVPATDYTFNRAILFSLANRMGIQELLQNHLIRFPFLKHRPTTHTTLKRDQNLTLDEQKRFLKKISDIWEQNNHLSFSEILIAVKPDNSSLDLYEVTDQEWLTGVTHY